MPFVAITEKGERVCSLDHKDLRPMYKPGELKCQLCHADMIYKHGAIVRPHFAHKEKCASDYEHKPESAEHLYVKEKVREKLLKAYPESTVDLEFPFPEIKRIADVVHTINGWRMVYEIQFSSLTVEDIAQRTADYESLGMAVKWLVGGNAATPAIRKWILDRDREITILEVTDLGVRHAA